MKRIEYIILTLIVLGGFFVRLYKINGPIADWHSWRQVDTASVTREYIKNGLNLLLPRYHDISSAQTGIDNPEGYRMVEFPLFNFFHYLVATNSSLSLEVSGRVVSIVASIVSAVFVYLLGKKYIGSWGGILAAFFFAFLPFNIYYSRAILPDPLAIMFALIALYFFDKKLAISALSFALALLVKPFVVFYGLVFVSKRLFIQKKYWACALIALTPFILWRLWISQYPEGIAHIKWMFNSDHIVGKPSYFKWLYGERIGHLILGSWGLIPLAFGIVATTKKNKFNLLFLLSGVLYMAVFATVNVRHDYYQLLLVPPLCLLLAQGTIKMWTNVVSRILVAFSIVVMFVTSGYLIREYYKINNPAIIEAGKAVDELTPKDAIVVAPYNKDTAFLYQTNRRGWPWVEGSIEDLISKGADYYVSVNFEDPATIYVANNFKPLNRSSSYVIVDLTKPVRAQ